ncbi:hypothetical protein TSAR_013302 [Trichomalopsis sarcophagae]|uniref:Uncharacterized protein n=1 Tax=Trichomalopsis sarcophagae TaxID=543379 RepID=A0A232EE74_9HYME|nr:hypothetical protein TSAR_013302 [Trichomalopsis sarcophagae]
MKVWTVKVTLLVRRDHKWIPAQNRLMFHYKIIQVTHELTPIYSLYVVDYTCQKCSSEYFLRTLTKGSSESDFESGVFATNDEDICGNQITTFLV